MDIKKHKLNVLQSIISRMASNSSNCKMWSITLLSAIMVLFLSKDTNLGMTKFIVLIPIVPFMFLDAFYLGLERHFVDEYNKEFKNGEKENILIIKENKGWERFESTIKALGSFSVWGFYLILLSTVSFILFIIECNK